MKSATKTGGVGSSAAVNSAVQQGSKYVNSLSELTDDPDRRPSLMYFVPLGLLGAYFAWRYYTSGSL